MSPQAHVHGRLMDDQVGWAQANDSGSTFLLSFYIATTAIVPAGEGDVRLSRGAAAPNGSAEYGRLEIFHKGGWGTVCDNTFMERSSRNPRFSQGSAAVACRQLGFQAGIQIQTLVRIHEVHSSWCHDSG